MINKENLIKELLIKIERYEKDIKETSSTGNLKHWYEGKRDAYKDVLKMCQTPS